MITRANFTKNFHHDTYPSLDVTQPSFSCKGKSIFITGAGSGIGKATAISFSRAGAQAVFLAGRTKSTLAETKTEIESQYPGTTVDYFVLNITDADKVNAAFSRAKEIAKKPIDVLVNNAGNITSIDTVATFDFDKIWEHFEVNVKGSLLIIRAFLENAEPSGATLINISSGAAILDFVAGLSGYGASKLATLKMVDYITQEEKGRDLRVFSIQPGIVPTAMAKEGKSIAVDKAELPADYCVWLTTPAADFLKGRFMYANWDINDLMQKKDEIVQGNLLTLAFRGWDSTAF